MLCCNNFCGPLECSEFVSNPVRPLSDHNISEGSRVWFTGALLKPPALSTARVAEDSRVHAFPDDLLHWGGDPDCRRSQAQVN